MSRRPRAGFPPLLAPTLLAGLLAALTFGAQTFAPAAAAASAGAGLAAADAASQADPALTAKGPADPDPAAAASQSRPAPGPAAPVPAASAKGPAAAPSVAGPGGPYDIERYLNIRAATSPAVSPDGTKVAFLTNITGSSQIWTIPAAGGWPDPITFFADRVSSPRWSPRGEWIAFAKDAGGDENYQIGLVSPDGARLEWLTSDPNVRCDLGRWARDGRRLSYASNERNRRYFDVYVVDVETRERRRVAQMDAYLAAGPFSDDGRRLIVSRQNGSLDNDLFVVPAAGGEGPAAEPVLLTPHEGIASYAPVGWTPDGKALWVVSDAGREFHALGLLDIGAKRIDWRYEPKWDVSGASLNREGSALTIVVNEDGYDTLLLTETAAIRPAPLPGVPPGQVDGIVVSEDGRTLAMSLTGHSRPSDIWIADLRGGTLSRVTRSSTAGIPPASFAEPTLVRYKTFDGLEIPAWLYLPPGARDSLPMPCIVSPHGGPEGQTVARFTAWAQYYLNRGYAIFAPNVRGSTGYGKTFTHLDDVRKREDSVKDLAAGVEWLKASGQIDPKKIVVMGGSYGGYMTLAAITLYPDLWAAAVDSYGIANFKTFLGRTASYRSALRATEYGDPDKDGDFLDAISPLFKVDRIRAPLLVLQGANDPRVPPHESEQIVAAVKKRGGVAEYVLFPDEGHGWAKLKNQITAYRTIADFLDRHVKGASRSTP